ncbi:MAG TPA: radical SAM protein [Elusimicrobiota bacterium]|nr:radical SAM protein [Elusimicrobiota bacterium]
MKTFDILMTQLHERGQNRPGLVQAMIELTYGCNLRCVHCYNPTHQARGELPTAKVIEILNQLAAQGCLWVGFTGGEIFTRPDALDLMRHAKELGMVVTLVTNASLVTRELASEIERLAPYQVDVSLYGATARTYEAVTRRPGSFDHFVRGLDALRERRIPVLLKLILMTLNRHEREPMAEFARSRSLPYQYFTEIHPRVDGNPEPLAYRLSADEAFQIWKETSPEAQRPERAAEATGACHGSPGRLFACLCGKSNAAITPHGKMNLCLSIYHPLYDLSAGTVGDGWQALTRVVQEARPGPQYECQTCALAEHCTRGSMDGWLEHGAFDAPCMPYFRAVAERKKDFYERPAYPSVSGQWPSAKK